MYKGVRVVLFFKDDGFLPTPFFSVFYTASHVRRLKPNIVTSLRYVNKC